MEEKPISYVFKICLVGSGAVGKTCIARRLCFNTFNAETQLTVGIDFYAHDIPIIVNGKETSVRLMIWDFGGQEQFKTLFNYYINGANGIFLVFDLSNLESLVKLEWWYEKLIQYNLQNHPKILVGTKLDLIASVDKKSKVDKYIIEKFLQKRNETDFVMTSSKENENILFSFKKMARKIMNSNNLEFDSIL
ncbi:MAG: Rab family GTPase [Promethearchaeota archaeon]|jgi:small GTP-binding protein